MIPGYVYGQSAPDGTLRQGDIILLEGEMREKFNGFFPGIVKPSEKRYLMVLSQCCDLYRDKRRECKLEHITLCVLSTFESHLKKIIALYSTEANESRLITEQEYENISGKLHKLINNSDPKNYIFLPKDKIFETDMIAVLSVNYPLRICHYDSLLEIRVATLNDEFRRKLGYVLGKLYSRIATNDLNGQENVINEFINEALAKVHVSRTPCSQITNEVLKKIKENSDISQLINEAIQEKIQKKLSDKKKFFVTYLNKFIYTNYKEVASLFDENPQICEGSLFRKKLREYLNDKINLKEISDIFGDGEND